MTSARLAAAAVCAVMVVGSLMGVEALSHPLGPSNTADDASYWTRVDPLLAGKQKQQLQAGPVQCACNCSDTSSDSWSGDFQLVMSNKQTESLQSPAAIHETRHHETPAAQPMTEATPRQPSVSQEARQQIRKYHVLVVQEGNIYMEWQMRIFYYWYLKAKAECEQQLGDTCEMGGLTRLLAARRPDKLMDEIPTFMYAPVTHTYKPLNRPSGLLQWLHKANIPEQYVMVCETDQFFLKPTPNLMGEDGRITGYPSEVVYPAERRDYSVMAEFMPSGILRRAEAKAYMDPSGNSPFIASMDQMRMLVPMFNHICERMRHSTAAKKTWQWMREMYAFIMAVHLTGLGPMNLVDDFVAIPGEVVDEGGPYEPAYLLHYNFPFNFFMNGTAAPNTKQNATDTWRFYKWDYTTNPPPRNLPEPPPAVTNPFIHTIIKNINEATQNIPCWNAYVDNSYRSDPCDEDIPGSIYPKPPQGGSSSNSGAQTGGFSST